MRRVFALDVVAWSRCGGRLRVIATIQDRAVVRAILADRGWRRVRNPRPDHPARPPGTLQAAQRASLPE